jgi:hypothetical protein
MYHDINAEHAEKTATYEDHAFLTRKFVLIRPSQHDNVMLQLVESLEGARRFCTPGDLFLNFIHTVVPTLGLSTPPIEIEAEPEESVLTSSLFGESDAEYGTSAQVRC